MKIFDAWPQANSPSRPLPYATLLVATALVYFAVGRMSLALAIPPGYASAVWPPSGIALAAVLLFGARVWPAVWIGAALVNVTVESSLLVAAAIASGNTLEALAGGALVRRHVGDPARFQRSEDVFKFIALCAVASAIAATVALVPLAAGGLSWAQGFRNWWTWWQGDLSGMIVVAPLILSWSAGTGEEWSAEKKLEAAVFAFLLLAAGALLTGSEPADFAPLSLTFVALPFIIWAALRFSQREVSTAIVVICAIAIWYTVKGGETASTTMNESLLMLLTFNSMVVATGLVLASVVAERGRAIQALRQRQDQLESSIRYDSLTGLPNATLFRHQLAQLVALGAESGRKVVVAVMDVERLRFINDAFGRQGGDELLRQIAARLAPDITGSSVVARVDGGRFAVAAYGFREEAAIGRAATERMERWFGPPFRLTGTELKLSARMGLAHFPLDGEHPETLYMHAESALMRAKRSGERCVFYAQTMSERAAETFSLESELRRAVERREFVLHYQPKVDLQMRRLTGVEALIRWRSRDRGVVPPLQFIPLLEETGLILEVGRWALGQAVCDQAVWAAKGLNVPRVAVNVSSIQLRHAGFVGDVQDAIAHAAGAPRIDLELTESCIMENVEATIAKLSAIRALGVGIAIDDFGTGYSSLAYLAKLPADLLKIDRSFISRMLEDDGSMTLVQTILSLANSLALKTVAEGVESEQQADMLALLGCSEMQGYLVSEPRPPEEIAAMLGARGAC
jgi:diguanylate cyclase (GGDEF)-like protein